MEASWAQTRGRSHTSRPRPGAESSSKSTRAQVFGSVVYQWGAPESKFRPFVLGGLGATLFEADDIPGETKLAWAVGAGAKLFFHRKLGIKLQAKFNPTLLNDESSDFCDPFGFCAGSVSSFELLSGVVFRF